MAALEAAKEAPKRSGGLQNPACFQAWCSITRDRFVLDLVHFGLQISIVYPPSNPREPRQLSWKNPTPEQVEWVQLADEWKTMEKVPSHLLGEKGEIIHNLVFEPKKGRLCSNTRETNKAVKKMKLKMESIKDLRHRAKVGRWILKVDISKFYWAMGIHPKHRKYFRFRVGGGPDAMALPSVWVCQCNANHGSHHGTCSDQVSVLGDRNLDLGGRSGPPIWFRQGRSDFSCCQSDRAAVLSGVCGKPSQDRLRGQDVNGVPRFRLGPGEGNHLRSRVQETRHCQCCKGDRSSPSVCKAVSQLGWQGAVHHPSPLARSSLDRGTRVCKEDSVQGRRLGSNRLPPSRSSLRARALERVPSLAPSASPTAPQDYHHGGCRSFGVWDKRPYRGEGGGSLDNSPTRGIDELEGTDHLGHSSQEVLPFFRRGGSPVRDRLSGGESLHSEGIRKVNCVVEDRGGDSEMVGKNKLLSTSVSPLSSGDQGSGHTVETPTEGRSLPVEESLPPNLQHSSISPHNRPFRFPVLKEGRSILLQGERQSIGEDGCIHPSLVSGASICVPPAKTNPKSLGQGGGGLSEDAVDYPNRSTRNMGGVSSPSGSEAHDVSFRRNYPSQRGEDLVFPLESLSNPWEQRKDLLDKEALEIIESSARKDTMLRKLAVVRKFVSYLNENNKSVFTVNDILNFLSSPKWVSSGSFLSYRMPSTLSLMITLVWTFLPFILCRSIERGLPG